MAKQGVVQFISGTVKAVSVNGKERILHTGDKVLPDEKIVTGDNGTVVIAFNDGTTLDLGRASELTLNDESLPALEVASKVHAGENAQTEVESIQRALADQNFDPTKALPATAAGSDAGGGTAQGGNEGHTFVVVDYIGPQSTPGSGFGTEGISVAFPPPQEVLILNPAQPVVVPQPTESEPTTQPTFIAVDEDDINIININEEQVSPGWLEEFQSSHLEFLTFFNNPGVGATDGNNSNGDEGPGDNLDDPSPTVVSGILNVNFGNDGPGDIIFNSSSQPLSSGGHPVQFWVSGDGHTIVGYITITQNFGEGEGTSFNKIIFSSEINDPATKSFTFTLYGALDHPNAAIEDNLSINLRYTVTDGNGDATTGVLGISVNDDSPVSSGSNVGILDEAALQESNNVLGGAQVIGRSAFGIEPNSDLGDDSLPSVSISGSISTDTDQDLYKVELQEGEHLYVDIDHTFGVDTVVTIYDADGNVVDFGDDSLTNVGGGGSENGFDSYIEYTVPSSGTYFIGVTSFGDFPGNGANQEFDGQSSGDYVLNLSIQPTEGSTGLGSDGNGSFSDVEVDGQVITGNLGLNYGADGPAQLASDEGEAPKPNFEVLDITVVDPETNEQVFFTSGNVEVTAEQTWTDKVLTITGTADGNPVYELIIDTLTGDYTFTLLGPIDHPDAGQTGLNDPLLFTLDFKVMDFDGDSAQAQLKVTIKDDGPSIFADDADLPSLSVDESGLPNGSTGIGPVSDSASFSDAFIAFEGADGASTRYAVSVTGQDGDTPLFDSATGQQVMLVMNGNGEVEGRAGSNEVFKVSVDPVTGEVTFTTYRAVIHGETDTPDDSIDLNGLVTLTATITDNDGDQASASIDLGAQLRIFDDVPQVNVESDKVIVDEDGLAGANADSGKPGEAAGTGSATATGNLADNFNFGADGGAISKIVSVNAVTADVNGHIIIDNANYKLDVTASTGDYSFTLKDNVNNGAVQAENLLDNALSLALAVVVEDGDGDRVTGNVTLNVDVLDDIPVLSVAADNVIVDEDGLAGANADSGKPGEAAGTGSATATGNLADNFSFGADGAAASKIVSVNTITADVNGHIIIDNANYKLDVTASTGDYSFTLKDNVNNGAIQAENLLDNALSLALAVVVEDGDGDRVTGNVTLNVDVLDDIPVLSVAADNVIVDEDGLAGANADSGKPGEAAGTGSATATGNLADNFSFGADGAAASKIVSVNTVTADVNGHIIIEEANYKLDVTAASGDYIFTLKDNVDNGAIQGENLLDNALSPLLAVVVEDGDGDRVTGNVKLNVDVWDDVPTAVADAVTVNENVIRDFNITIVLDRSGSMANNPDGPGGFTSRLDLAKAAVTDLLNQYETSFGAIKVMVVDFATSAGHSAWLSVTDALAYLDGLAADGATNYDAALQEVRDHFGESGKVTGPDVSNVVYFLSDGVPTSSLSSPNEDINPQNQINLNFGDGIGEENLVPGDLEVSRQEWEEFLSDTDQTAYAVGIGAGANVAQLQPIAFPNGDPSNPVVVTNESQLSDALLATVPPINEITGNLIVENVSNDLFGADGPGAIPIFSVEDLGGGGVRTLAAPGAGGSVAGNVLTFTTGLGGTIHFHFDTGEYTYVSPAILSDQAEHFKYTIQDTDGDRSTASLDINILHVAPPTTDNVTTTGAEDAPSIAITLTGNDPDGTPEVTNFRLSSLPINGTLYTNVGLSNLAAIGVDYAAVANALILYFVPIADFNGSVNFQYIAKDNEGLYDQSPATATITVTPVADLTVANDDSIITAINNDDRFTVPQWALLANDSDVDGPLSISSVTTSDSQFDSVSLASSNVSINTDGSFDPPDVAAFAYTASDGTSSDTASVTVKAVSAGTITGTGSGEIIVDNDSGHTVNAGGGDDIVFGNGGNDVLNGEGGNDILVGGIGNDTLFGSIGADTLVGGTGNDTFTFTSTVESGTTLGLMDVITDFQHPNDHINLSAIDANSNVTNNQTFGFGGNSVTTIANSITWAQSGTDTVVSIDTNGVAGAEMQIILQNTVATTLQNSDFIP